MINFILGYSVAIGLMIATVAYEYGKARDQCKDENCRIEFVVTSVDG